MSQKDPKPHTVKVYGYEGEGAERRLVTWRTVNFPSKGAAEKFASDQRRIPEVSSAVVMPTGAAVRAQDKVAT